MSAARLHVAFLLLCLGALAAAEPVFQPDGTILIGSMRLRQTGGNEIALTGPGGATTFFYSISLRSGGGSRWIEGGKTVVDQATRSVSVRGGLTLEAGKPAVPVSWGYQLLPDGAIRIALDLRAAGGAATGRVSNHTRRSLFVNQPLAVDGRTFEIPPLSGPEDKQIMLFNGPARELAYTLGLPARCTWALEGLSPVIMDSRLTTRDGGGLVRIESSVTAPLAAIDLRLEDLGGGTGEEVHNGIDYGVGGLHLVRRLAGNLVENPGFEQGLRGWDMLRNGSGAVRSLEENYRVVEEGAFEGRRCLEIAIDASSPGSVAPFSLPVEANRPYTISFHARTDLPGIRLGVLTVHGFASGPGIGPFTLDGEWKRYSGTVTVPNGLLSVGISPPGGKVGAHIWIDAVQVEPGEKPGPFTSRPVGAELVSKGRGNLLEPGAPVGAALRLDGRAGLGGTLAYTATAFDGRKVHDAKVPFDLGSAGTSRIELPWAEKLGPGQFLVETVITPKDGDAVRDWHRLTIMPSPPARFRHSTILSGGSYDGRRGAWERTAAFFQRCGVGANVSFHLVPEGFRTACEQHGVLTYAAIYSNLDVGFDIQKDYAKLTAEQLKKVEDACFAKAKANPAIRQWKTVNEPAPHPLVGGPGHEERMKAFIALQAAAYRGIKRADPKMQVMTPDCSNMYPEGGLGFIEAWFAAGGGAVSDIAAIHPYRPRPEDPDLDAHTALLLGILDRHRFTGEVWFTEGLYHQPYHVPALGLSPHSGCSTDHFRCTPLSYHLARAERMCAAYTMRSWLVGLKHASRVRNQVDWGFPFFARMLDLDFTPGLTAFASNTLACLLGDATWRSDVELGAGVRCYLFEDAQQRPVAAIWSCDEARDLGTAKGGDPVLALPALPPGSEAFALDGSALATGPATAPRLAVTPWPVFLRGPAGSLAKLRTALDAGGFPDGTVAQLRTGLRLVTPDAAKAQVTNLLGRPMRGRLVVQSGKTVLHDAVVDIAARAAATVTVPVTMTPGALAQVEATIAFTPEGASAASTQTAAFACGAIPRLRGPPTLDGDLATWPAAIALAHRPIERRPQMPAERTAFPDGVPWKGQDDLSAGLRLAWDDGHLYLAVEVRDDVHDPVDEAARSTLGDGLRLVIDAWGDARERGAAGWGNDDQAFTLSAVADGTVRVMREVAPERQISFLDTGPVKGAKAAFRRQGGRSIYVVALPIEELAPMKLAPGSVIGLAVQVNDRDKDYAKRSLTMTAPGTEAFMHPELLPLWVLAP